MKQRIYLAGPITGLTYDEAAYGWREEIAPMLSQFTLVDPLRGKEFLANQGPLVGEYADFPMSSTNGILGRDRNDVYTCDLMIACFLEADGNVSLGTAMEFGWADSKRKPVIMVAKEGDPHREHPMLRGASLYVVPSLVDAARLAHFVLVP